MHNGYVAANPVSVNSICVCVCVLWSSKMVQQFAVLVCMVLCIDLSSGSKTKKKNPVWQASVQGFLPAFSKWLTLIETGGVVFSCVQLLVLSLQLPENKLVM